MKFLILALATLPIFAQALVVSDCPRTLSITYGSIHGMADSELGKYSSTYPMADLFAERDTLARALPNDYQGLRFTLEEAKYGQCRYLAAGEKLNMTNGANETRLMTVDGRDIVRVSLKVGGRYFWVRHNLAKYSTSGILIERYAPAKVMGVFDHRYPHVYLGWANEPMIE